jgi:hypothetical protein
MSDPRRKERAPTESRAGVFLFENPEEQVKDSKFLDMRTVIKSSSMMGTVIFYDILAFIMGSDSAQELNDALKRTAVSRDGLGRQNAVDVLRQALPKTREIGRGSQTMSDKMRQEFGIDDRS